MTINKQALRMRNYLDTALKSGVKLLHLSTDELEGLLDENLQLQRDKDSLEAVAIAMRDDMRDACEKLEAAEKRIAEANKLNAELTAKIEPMDRRIAELERSETQLISERDDAESALNDVYKAVMGQAPEWSNWFSFESAIDEIELACELWRNQTDDVIQFRQRIAELEARTVTLPPTFWYEHDDLSRDVPVLDKRLVKKAIRAAGIKVIEGEQKNG